MWAEPGSKLQVTITASNYGAFGQVVETLPDLFTLERTSLDDSQYDNDSEPREVLFYLLGETSFNYVVTVPAMEGPTPSPASSRTLNAGSSASRATRSFRSAAAKRLHHARAHAYTTPTGTAVRTATPAPSTTPVPLVEATPDASNGTPAVVWLIPVLFGIGALLALYFYFRRNS